MIRLHGRFVEDPSGGLWFCSPYGPLPSFRQVLLDSFDEADVEGIGWVTVTIEKDMRAGAPAAAREVT